VTGKYIDSSWSVTFWSTTRERRRICCSIIPRTNNDKPGQRNTSPLLMIAQVASLPVIAVKTAVVVEMTVV